MRIKFLSAYVKYLKDNPQGYWFKRKLFGWGWTPVKWQGFLVIFVYIATILFLASMIDKDATFGELIFPFFLPFILLSIILIAIAHKTGEKPHWQWGLPRRQAGIPKKETNEQKGNQ